MNYVERTSETLSKAFADLNRQGFIAREDYECCSGCGGGAITGEAEEIVRRTQKNPLGACFYHRQDAESRDEGRNFYLTFGDLNSQKLGHMGLSTEEVGKRVVETLKKYGIGFEWSGDPEQRIEILVDSLRDWNPSRPEVDYTDMWADEWDGEDEDDEEDE